MIRKALLEPQIRAWLSGISPRATSRSRNPHVPFGNQPKDKLLHSMSKHTLMFQVLAAPWSSCHSLNYSLQIKCTVKTSEPLQRTHFAYIWHLSILLAFIVLRTSVALKLWDSSLVGNSFIKFTQVYLLHYKVKMHPISQHTASLGIKQWNWRLSRNLFNYIINTEL